MCDFLKLFILAIISFFLFGLLDITIKIQKQNQQIIELLEQDNYEVVQKAGIKKALEVILEKEE